MSTQPAETAARLRRPSWRDGRLLVGLLLVLCSVLLGARLVATADDTIPVWAARTALAPGQALTAHDLVSVRVRLGSGAAAYMDAARPPPSGLVVLRTVGAGELVPRSAAGPSSALARRPVAIPLDGDPPGALRAGGLVDVWVSRRDRSAGAGAYSPPQRLVTAAPVQAVAEGSGSLGASRTTTVEVLLDDSQLPAVLDALANGARTALVPIPGSAPTSVDGR